jgi:hypothetical protein
MGFRGSEVPGVRGSGVFHLQAERRRDLAREARDRETVRTIRRHFEVDHFALDGGDLEAARGQTLADQADVVRRVDELTQPREREPHGWT